MTDTTIRVQAIRSDPSYQESLANVPATEIRYVQNLMIDTNDPMMLSQVGNVDLIRDNISMGRLLNKLCHGCKAKNVPLRRCSKCHLVFYCSVECQRSDWINRHKQWCCHKEAPLDAPEFLLTFMHTKKPMEPHTWVDVADVL